MKIFNFEYCSNACIEITLWPTFYNTNGNLAIEVYYKDLTDSWTYFELLTMNMPDVIPINKAYVNEFEMGDNIMNLLIRNNIGELTGNIRKNGENEYREFLFYESELKSFGSPDYLEYIKCKSQNKTWKKKVIRIPLFPKCSSCGEVFPIPLTHRELGKYEEYLFNQNLYIQNIFPEMKPEIRELLSKEPGPHLCAKCWENQKKSGGEG